MSTAIVTTKPAFLRAPAATIAIGAAGSRQG